MLEKDSIYEDLVKLIDINNVFRDEPMNKHTSFKTGGVADFFITVETENQLKKILEYAKQKHIQITVVGNGTNLLVRDKGIRGIVVKPKMQEIKLREENNKILIEAGAATPIIKLSKMAQEHNLQGLEFAVRNTRNNWWSNKNERRSIWIRNIKCNKRNNIYRFGL